MTPQEYWNEYPSDDDTETRGEIVAKQWIKDVNTFKTLIRVCPFPISKEAEEWIENAIIDI